MIDYRKVGDVYLANSQFTYYSPRYQDEITIPVNYPSNGANAVRDLVPDAFFIHDRGCEIGKWDSGKKICNFQLSFIYYDILRWHSVPFPQCAWRWLGTFLLGGGEARKNGLFRVKK